jgi:hypothetical protein
MATAFSNIYVLLSLIIKYIKNHNETGTKKQEY